MGKNTELIYTFWDSQAFSRNGANLNKTTLLLLHICCAGVSSFNIYKQEFKHTSHEEPMIK